jgi:hypothetical protein
MQLHGLIELDLGRQLKKVDSVFERITLGCVDLLVSFFDPF